METRSANLGRPKIISGVGIPSGSTHMITLVAELGTVFPTSAFVASATKALQDPFESQASPRMPYDKVCFLA